MFPGDKLAAQIATPDLAANRLGGAAPTIGQIRYRIKLLAPRLGSRNNWFFLVLHTSVYERENNPTQFNQKQYKLFMYSYLQSFIKSRCGQMRAVKTPSKDSKDFEKTVTNPPEKHVDPQKNLLRLVPTISGWEGIIRKVFLNLFPRRFLNEAKAADLILAASFFGASEFP